MRIKVSSYLSVVILLIILTLAGCNTKQELRWSERELNLINTLLLPDPNNPLERLTPVDHGNGVSMDRKAASLGQHLFFDPRLSGNGKVSCSSCHQPSRAFSDNEVVSQGMGVTAMHTPTIIGVATSPWLFWDGRADSLWSQALGPLENSVEHGANRVQLAHVIFNHYRKQYQEIFGPLPKILSDPNFVKLAMPLLDVNDASAQSITLAAAWHDLPQDHQRQINRVFANIGKSIAAYERMLMPTPSRFDRFATELARQQHSNLLTAQEQAGLKLFINDKQTQCLRCHNGPMFTNHDFQVTGIRPNPAKNTGRIAGVEVALRSEFNCAGIYSDTPQNCPELTFAKRGSRELKFAYKVPTLRNIGQTAPYMHNGSFSSLMAVLTYYNQAQPQLLQGSGQRTDLVHYDLQPLRLMPHQLKQLEAFLLTLNSAPADTNAWFKPPVLY